MAESELWPEKVNVVKYKIFCHLTICDESIFNSMPFNKLYNIIERNATFVYVLKSTLLKAFLHF